MAGFSRPGCGPSTDCPTRIVGRAAADAARRSRDTVEVERLKAENARLTDRLEASEDRLAVLERIVTDKSYSLASEIEALREQPARLQDKGNVQ